MTEGTSDLGRDPAVEIWEQVLDLLDTEQVLWSGSADSELTEILQQLNEWHNR